MMVVGFMVSCSKDKTLTDTDTRNTSSKDNYTQQKEPKVYRVVTCVYIDKGVKYSAIECAVGMFKQCKQQADCYPINYNGKWLPIEESFPSSWGFSEEEKNKWKNGEDIIETSDDYIDSHYGFFLQMYELGITLHPDTIKMYN